MNKYIVISEDDYEDLFLDIEEVIETLEYNSFFSDKQDLVGFINDATNELSSVLKRMETKRRNYGRIFIPKH